MSVRIQAQRERQQDQRQHHAEHRDRDAADPRVLARRDRLAAMERAARRDAAAELDDRQVAGDEQAEHVEDDEDPAGVDRAQAGEAPASAVSVIVLRWDAVRGRAPVGRRQSRAWRVGRAPSTGPRSRPDGPAIARQPARCARRRCG